MNKRISCLNYGNVNSETFMKGMIGRNQGCGCNSETTQYLLNAKLPQVVSVVPTYRFQSQTAQGMNRYISSVDVAPILPSTMTVTLAAAAIMTFTSPYLVTGTTTDAAVATVAITGTTATITGVAAGTATITLTDGRATITTIEVTVA